MCILESERLILRAPKPSDIAAMTVWLGDYNVAKNTAQVPHPYNEADAEAFVAGTSPRRGGRHYTFSILRRTDGLFIGGCGLHEDEPGEDQAMFEFGYWLGVPFWGCGYGTEAARRLVQFAFEMLQQTKVHAGWFHDNPVSGRVLAKLGAVHNGSRMRQSKARCALVLCHDMLLTRENFLRKQAVKRECDALS